MNDHPLELAGILADAVFTAIVILGSVAVVSARSDSWGSIQAKTLQDEVASETEPAPIEQLVRGIDDVREVESLFTIPPHDVPEPIRTDAELEEAVRNAFANDLALSSSDLDVISVEDGIVTLGGDAVTMTAHARALQSAFRVPGVLGLKASIDSPDVLSEVEMSAHASARQEAPAPPPAMQASQPATFGSRLRDRWITAVTKMRLIGNPLAPGLDIDVDTENREITLFGMVPSSAARAAAEAEAKSVNGVAEVKNELQIVQPDRRANAKASDEALRTVVSRRMAARTDFEDDGIDVDVSNGVVRLTGTVESGADRLAALECARAIPGVRSAIDDLRIAQSAAASK